MVGEDPDRILSTLGQGGIVAQPGTDTAQLSRVDRQAGFWNFRGGRRGAQPIPYRRAFTSERS